MAKKQATYQLNPTTIKALKSEAKRRKIANQILLEELILKGLKK